MIDQTPKKDRWKFSDHSQYHPLGKGERSTRNEPNKPKQQIRTGRKPIVFTALDEKIVKLNAEGMPSKKIAKKCKVSIAYTKRILNRMYHRRAAEKKASQEVAA